MVCAVITSDLAILFIDKFNCIYINLNELLKYSWLLNTDLPFINSHTKCIFCEPASNILYSERKNYDIHKFKPLNFYYVYTQNSYLINNIVVCKDLI